MAWRVFSAALKVVWQWTCSHRVVIKLPSTTHGRKIDVPVFTNLSLSEVLCFFKERDVGLMFEVRVEP